MNDVIGSNIKVLRESKAWTQLQLAEAASITDRTVQRAEEGRGLSSETLLAIAGALDVSLDVLRTDPRTWMAQLLNVAVEDVTPELIKARVDEANARFIRVPASKVERASHLQSVLDADAIHFATRDVSEPVEDIAAEINDSLQDLMNLRGLGPRAEREQLKIVFELVTRLSDHSCSVSVGLHRHAIQPSGGKAMPWSTLYVVVSRADDAPAEFYVDRKAVFRIA